MSAGDRDADCPLFAGVAVLDSRPFSMAEVNRRLAALGEEE
jgi:hypothetical protein